MIDDFGGEFASPLNMASFLQTMFLIFQSPSIDIVGSGLIPALTCN